MYIFLSLLFYFIIYFIFKDLFAYIILRICLSDCASVDHMHAVPVGARIGGQIMELEFPVVGCHFVGAGI